MEVVPDEPPQIAVAGQPELEGDGFTSLAFAAQDDYGVAAGQVRIALDLAAVERRHGLTADPTRARPLCWTLPLPLSGSRKEFTEKLIEDFEQHPWANLPVVFTFSAVDEAGQSFATAGFGTDLVTRRFFDPLAAAVIEQRRDLLWRAPMRRGWRRSCAPCRTGLRAFTAIMAITFGCAPFCGGLKTTPPGGAIPEAQQAEITAALWDLAIQMEDGDVGNALERMQRAQERLSQAMRDGASEQEIARLMQELREATQDYLRQLSRQAEANGETMEPGEMPEDMMTLSRKTCRR